MKAIFTADCHLHNWPQFSTRLANGMNSRLYDCLAIWKQMGQVAKERKVDHIFILGDVFESRTKLDVDVAAHAVREIVALAKTVRQYVWILQGNHDLHARAGDVHSLELFRNIPKVTVIDKPWVCLPIAGAHIAAFPYTSDINALRVEFSKLINVDLVLIHQAIREGTIGPYARTVSAELSVTDLPMDKCRYVFAGDYHRRQFFGPGDRVHYIGSPLQLKADEVGEVKGFTYIDTDRWEVETIPTKFPEFLLFNNPEDAGFAIANKQADPEKDFIRVKYEDACQTAAADLKARYARLQIDEVKELRSLARTTAAIFDSDFLLCQEFADQRNTEFETNTLLSVGLELLEGE